MPDPIVIKGTNNNAKILGVLLDLIYRILFKQLNLVFCTLVSSVFLS